MAEIWGRKGNDGAGWNIDIADADKIGMCGPNFGDTLSVGGFQASTHKTNGDMSVDGCDPNHMRNCKYVSKTQVSLMGAGAVILNAGNVGQGDCTQKLTYQNDATNTALSNIKFFFYDGSDPANAPVGVVALAFEHDGAQINVDRDSDAPGDGGAWDSSKGIGGSVNALKCSDQASVAIHSFYFGISIAPGSAGLKTAVKSRLEFDAQ